MTDYFSYTLDADAIRAISSIGLAHLGDAVYELLVRTYLCAHGKATGKGLHRATVELVCAPKQAELADAVDVTRQTIISLENGRYNASLLLAHKIAKYFGMTIEEVFLFEEEEA